VALLAASGVASWTWAQPVDPQKLATAQELYNQGLSALADKDYASACPKLEEVTRILPNGVGGLIALAHCYEGAGKLASAWTTYLVAQASAARANRKADESEARTRAEALKPRLAWIVIVVPSAVGSLPGLSITRDGIPVGAAQWGTPVPVDKGEHLVVATANERERGETIVEVPDDGASVSVEVPALRNAVAAADEIAPPPSHPPRSDVGIAPSGAVSAGPALAPPPATGSAQRLSGALLLGVGGAGIVVGAVAGGLVFAQHGSLAAVCADGRCPLTQKGNLDTYHAKSLASTIGLIGGAALAATGLVVLLTSPKRARAPTARLIPYLGPGEIGVCGRF
jgi:hypothetical protein